MKTIYIKFNERKSKRHNCSRDLISSWYEKADFVTEQSEQHPRPEIKHIQGINCKVYYKSCA